MSRSVSIGAVDSKSPLHKNLKIVSRDCTECGACVHSCSFLKKHGNPGRVAKTVLLNNSFQQSLAFECSLCSHCAAVCPAQLKPQDLYLELRREINHQNLFNKKPYAPILAYEKIGTSSLFTFEHIPKNCSTIFFPGCSLPGTRPGNMLKAYKIMKSKIPHLGIVLDCCGKPSHDLGMNNRFNKILEKQLNRLTKKGVKKIILACPNCHMIFEEYAPHLTIKNMYDYFPETDSKKRNTQEVTVHDPCGIRNNTQIHDRVRKLIRSTGVSIAEKKHIRTKTFCCGEGGSVPFISKDLAASWTDKIHDEAKGKKIITYCAGCHTMLKDKGRPIHLIDLIFNRDTALQGKSKVSSSPGIYLNRLVLKLRLHFLRAKSSS